MTLIIDLTREQESKLKAEADARGIDPESVIQDLVELLPSAGAEKPKTGAELLARLKAEGLFDPEYGDPALDSPEMARAIREGRWPPREQVAEGKEAHNGSAGI